MQGPAAFGVRRMGQAMTYYDDHHPALGGQSRGGFAAGGRGQDTGHGRGAQPQMGFGASRAAAAQRAHSSAPWQEDGRHQPAPQGSGWDHAGWQQPDPWGAHPQHGPAGAAWHGGQGRPDDARFRADGAGVAPVRVGSVLSGSGAVLSLALIAGLAWWSWQLVARDVNGVPVVRALEGPMRVAPAEPGGRIALFQGLSVNSIPAGTPAAPAGSELVLAPRPVDLSAEDVPIAAAPVQPAAASGGVNAGAALPADAAALVAPAQGGGIAAPPAAVAAVERSPRPPMRPAMLQASGEDMTAFAASASADDIALAVASSVAMRMGPQSGAEIDSATLAAGTRLVQLGTFPTGAAAREAWDTLAQRFNPLFDGHSRVVEAAHSGGTVFYRLRVHGFEDEAASRRFCAVLLGQNSDCIPVLIR